jgi:O-antigen/teichoic acid export membrane protein
VIISKFKKNRSIKNIALIALGTAGAQAITIACAPIITRIYSPEAFGLAGTFTALMAVAAPLAALTLPMAMTLEKSDESAIKIAKLSLIITASMVLALLVAVLLLGNKDYLAGDVLVLLPFITFGVFALGIYQIFDQWCIRGRLYKVKSQMEVAQAAITNLIKIVAGIQIPAGLTLVFITAIAPGIHFFLLAFGITKAKKVEKCKSASEQPAVNQSYIQLLKRHKSFPIFRAPQIALNAFSQSLPILMLNYLFGPASAGYYALARTVIGLPSSLVSKAVGEVYYPKLNDALDAYQPVAPIIRKATMGLLLLGLIPFIALFIYGPELFNIIFGSQWSEAGHYARLLTIFFLFNFINSPCVAAAPVLKIQHGLLVYEILSSALKAAALYLGFYVFNSDSAAIFGFAISGALSYGGMIGWIYFKALMRDSNGKAGK